MGVKISALPAASALTGAELIPVVQSGATVQSTAGDVLSQIFTPETTAETAAAVSIVNPYRPSDQSLVRSARYSSTNTWDYRTDQRLFEIYLSKYGAVFNGTSDDSAAIADSINAIQAIGGAGAHRVVMPSGALVAKIATAGAITFYCGGVGVDFNGLAMDASSITTGNVITVTGSGSAYSTYGYGAGVYTAPYENFILAGPTTGTPTTVLVYLNGGSPVAGQISGGLLRNFMLRGGYTCLQMAANVYIIGFDNFYIGNASQYGVYWQGGTNSGENINWRNGQIANCVNSAQTAIGLYMSSGAADTDMYFQGVSFDYCNQLIDQRSGHLELDGCHIETGTTGTITSGPGFVNVQQDAVSAEIATFMFRGKVNMNGTAAKVFTCSKGLATDVRIHAHVDNYSGTTQLVNITDSSAVNVEFKGNLQLWTGTTLYGPLNTTYNGDFELGNLNGWTASGAAIFSVQSTTKHSGTYALEATAASASTGSEYQVIPVRQGQRIYSDLWANVTAITGGTFGVNINFYSDFALTNKIGTGITASVYTAVTTGWVENPANGIVPVGANYMSVAIYATGFIGTAYIDDIKVAIF